MLPSRNGYLSIAKREALVLVAYPDPTWDSPSIGFGHNDKTLKQGDTITIPEAFTLLKNDVAARAVDLDRWLKVPVSQQQFDALISFYYEYGTKGSTVQSTIEMLNQRNMAAVATYFVGACISNGSFSLGLLVRRIEELLIFFAGIYTDIGTCSLFTGLPASTTPQTYTIQAGDL